jgi:biotin carboxylase
MVELGARMGGDCITTHLVPLSTGIDMIKATIDICLGEEPDIAPRFDKGSAIRFFNVPYGTITAIDGVEEAQKIPGVQEISFTKTVGEKAGEIGSSTDRAGFVIVQAESADAAADACEIARNAVRFTVEDCE